MRHASLLSHGARFVYTGLCFPNVCSAHILLPQLDDKLPALFLFVVVVELLF